ncbi:cupin domain-containing protein [Aliidiomarina sp. Khilg15.8]
MYKLNSAVFDTAHFLANDWQKQPRVFRQAFPNFVDPIGADELAGVALEPGVDSRLISQRNGQWDVTHGPIEDFSDVADSQWSLLVQAVNEHFPPAQHIIEAFRFLPDWRIDDLMVSYSTPGGGVGPHLDQYDVFIIQGSGQRRWQVGAAGEYDTVTPHPDLKQVPGFEPVLDEVLNPGDMIYIPAGFPHSGDSLQESLNYSVGFRAPSQAELLSALADHALEHDALQTRYTDTATMPAKSWHVHSDAFAQFRQLITEAMQDESTLDRVVAGLLSQNPRPPLMQWPAEPVTESGLVRYLQRHDLLQKAVGLRMITAELDGRFCGLVQGHEFTLDADAKALFEYLLNTHYEIETSALLPFLTSTASRQLLQQLINEGFWFVADYDEDNA